MKKTCLLLFILGVATRVVSAADNATLYAQYFQQAAMNQNSGNYEEAVHFHKLALGEMQKPPLAPDEYIAAQMTNLSTALWRLEEYEEALFYSGQAAELIAPLEASLDRRLHIMLNHGTLLALNDKIGLGEKICQDHLVLLPEGDAQYDRPRGSVYYCFAIFRLKDGDWEKAEEYSQKSRSLVSSPEALEGFDRMYARHRAAAERQRGESSPEASQ